VFFYCRKAKGVRTIEGITKATEISNAKIQFVSLVNAAANQRQFLLTKAKDSKANFKSYGKIIKKDSKNHYVTGIVYEPKKEDTQGDFMTEEEITKAAYYFAKNSNKIDLQHNFEPLKGASVVESWIAKADFYINDEAIQKGTWLMTVEIADDAIWDKIEKGEITGFSMGGFGEFSKEDKNLEDLTKQEKETNEKKGLFKQFAEAFGFSVVEKSGKKMSTKNKETLKSIYENMGAFLKEFDDMNEQNEEEKTMTREEIEQMVAEAVKKAMQSNQPKPKEPDKTEEEITQQKIEKMVQQAVEKATEPQQQQNISMEQVEEMITKAVTKAVEPILKSAGVPSNLNDNGSLQKSAEKQHYMHGIL